MDKNKKNKLDEVPIADLNNNELKQVKNFEKNNLQDKYYLIAFKKTQTDRTKL